MPLPDGLITMASALRNEAIELARGTKKRPTKHRAAYSTASPSDMQICFTARRGFHDAQDIGGEEGRWTTTTHIPAGPTDALSGVVKATHSGEAYARVRPTDYSATRPARRINVHATGPRNI